jgi:hypothetical protein
MQECSRVAYEQIEYQTAKEFSQKSVYGTL